MTVGIPYEWGETDNSVWLKIKSVRRVDVLYSSVFIKANDGAGGFLALDLVDVVDFKSPIEKRIDTSTVYIQLTKLARGIWGNLVVTGTAMNKEVLKQRRAASVKEGQEYLTAKVVVKRDLKQTIRNTNNENLLHANEANVQAVTDRLAEAKDIAVAEMFTSSNSAHDCPYIIEPGNPKHVVPVRPSGGRIVVSTTPRQHQGVPTRTNNTGTSKETENNTVE